MKSSKLPHGWAKIELHKLMEKTQSVNPSKFPQKIYELWSVPSFPSDIPEFLHGKDIGSNKQLVEPGDVLLCKINPRINRVWLVREKNEAEQIASTEWIILRPEKLYPKYIMYQLREADFRNRLCADLSGVGGSLTRARPKIVGNLEIKIAPINEQERIVTKIEELKSHSNQASDALETIPDLLQQLRQSILAAAFRGDLTKKWREENKGKTEPAAELLKRIRIERRKRWEEAELDKLRAKGLSGDKLDAQFAKRCKKYQEPELVNTTGLPELPEGWCWATLADLALIKGGLTKGKKRSDCTKLKKIPYLRVANVQRGYLDLGEVLNIQATDAEINDLLLQQGDILLNEGGDLDKLGRGWVWNCEIEKCIHQNHVFRARLVSLLLLIPELISSYINEFGQNYFIVQGKQTTNLASVSLTNLSKTPVPLMSRNEALQLWEEIKSYNYFVKRIELSILIMKDQIAHFEKSVLAKAFQGELVSQDPNDEPASTLLECIQAERSVGKDRLRNSRLNKKR